MNGLPTGSGDTTLFWRRVIKRRTAKWLHGLIGGFISGGTTVGTSTTGTAVAHAAGLPVEVMTLGQIGTVFVFSGIVGAILYLKQSPLPSISRKLEPTDDEVESIRRKLKEPPTE